MKRSMKISALMYKLLIEKKMDGFSIIEARDSSLSLEDETHDLVEARKRIYRQIWQYQKRNWLRSEGAGRSKRYFQTDQFRVLQVTAQKKVEPLIKERNSDYSVLFRESKEYKGELEIVLGEIDEYQSLRYRFPELENKLTPLLQQAKQRSAHLLGKVNVLTNVLNVLSEGKKTC
ncbi:hypothetical protein [Aliivibrio finisterrensis]|uniref:Transcriptional regulator VspR n=1 Tax=Aliivibrio finisterrensis TaxID=511998 RepID=A0A6N6RRN4_9GAMM|nr:hypothetical protein [Aliivibrio finisterrensis]KAB2824225.1 hypothetical protein F8B77_11465 [Aliivibrio finisterrensis]